MRHQDYDRRVYVQIQGHLVYGYEISTAKNDKNMDYKKCVNIC